VWTLTVRLLVDLNVCRIIITVQSFWIAFSVPIINVRSQVLVLTKLDVFGLSL